MAVYAGHRSHKEYLGVSEINLTVNIIVNIILIISLMNSIKCFIFLI